MLWLLRSLLHDVSKRVLTSLFLLFSWYARGRQTLGLRGQKVTEVWRSDPGGTASGLISWKCTDLVWVSEALTDHTREEPRNDLAVN